MADVSEADRTSVGGGVAGDGEMIEVLALPLATAGKFLIDGTVPKSAGLMVGIMAALMAEGQAGGQGGGLLKALMAPLVNGQTLIDRISRIASTHCAATCRRPIIDAVRVK
jgi:hypothetical protein